MDPIAYLLLKLVVYSIWCFVGLALVRTPPQLALHARAVLGIRMGLIRFGIGVASGALIFILVNIIFPLSQSNTLTYLSIYGPVRWIEWSIMLIFIRIDDGWSPFRASFRSAIWRLGGVTLSCLSDIPVWDGIGIAKILAYFGIVFDSTKTVLGGLGGFC